MVDVKKLVEDVELAYCTDLEKTSKIINTYLQQEEIGNNNWRIG